MENGGIRGNLFSVAAVVSVCAALALIVCTQVLASTYRARLDNPKKMDQSLQVTGSARKRIRSDLGVWRIRVSGSGEDQKKAFAALKTTTERVNKFLESRKFQTSEITPSAITNQPKYAVDRRGNETHEQIGCTLTRTITISSPRVDDVATAAPEVTEMIQEGLEVVSDVPEYYYTKIGDLKIEMIGEAAKDARSRGDQITTKAGCSISEVRAARMGVLQITRPDCTDVSASGIYDTTTIDKDVTSVVSLTFGLDR
jgi:uncharacterized protein